MPTYTQPCGYAVTVDTSDLIHIFKPYSSGSTPAPDTGYKANSNYGGQDLSKIFQPRDGSPAIGNTNYRLSDGTDLAIVFMDINYTPYSANIIDNGIKVTPNIYDTNTAYYQFNNVGSNSSFQIYNPTAPIVVNYILIGGGGGGGSSGVSNTLYGTGPGSGTGGEGGQCTSGSFAISSNNTNIYDVTIGGGGLGGQAPSIPPKPSDESNGNGGNPGTLSKIEIISSILLESSGGAGGYGGYNNSGAGSDQNGPNTYSENLNKHYGGGGGAGSAGEGQSGTGSAGGSIGGTVTSYDGTTFIWGGGGGGGNANGSTSNSGGSNNNGGYGGNYSGSNESGGSASTPGGGGGGGVSTGGSQVESWPGASGGEGGQGTLLIWWTIPS